ncbi:MAG: hypothetical protein ACE5IZ_01180 [Dehalococcoidia bacterium]
MKVGDKVIFQTGNTYLACTLSRIGKTLTVSDRWGPIFGGDRADPKNVVPFDEDLWEKLTILTKRREALNSERRKLAEQQHELFMELARQKATSGR